MGRRGMAASCMAMNVCTATKVPLVRRQAAALQKADRLYSCVRNVCNSETVLR